MEVSIRYRGNVRFEAVARGHRVVSDQPAVNGGADGGMTPPELLLLSSLGTCAGYYAAEYLRARSLSADGLEIHVSAGKALQPARLAQFRIEVTVPRPGRCARGGHSARRQILPDSSHAAPLAGH